MGAFSYKRDSTYHCIWSTSRLAQVGMEKKQQSDNVPTTVVRSYDESFLLTELDFAPPCRPTPFRPPVPLHPSAV